MLPAFPSQNALRISEGDQYLLYLRNLPEKVQEFALHCAATTVTKLWEAVNSYYVRMRMTGDLDKVHVAQGKPTVLSLDCSKTSSQAMVLLESTSCPWSTSALPEDAPCPLLAGTCAPGIGGTVLCADLFIKSIIL